MGKCVLSLTFCRDLTGVIPVHCFKLHRVSEEGFEFPSCSREGRGAFGSSLRGEGGGIVASSCDGENGEGGDFCTCLREQGGALCTHSLGGGGDLCTSTSGQVGAFCACPLEACGLFVVSMEGGEGGD